MSVSEDNNNNKKEKIISKFLKHKQLWDKHIYIGAKLIQETHTFKIKLKK